MWLDASALRTTEFGKKAHIIIVNGEIILKSIQTFMKMFGAYLIIIAYEYGKNNNLNLLSIIFIFFEPF